MIKFSIFQKAPLVLLLLLVLLTGCEENNSSNKNPISSDEDVSYYVNNIYSYWSSEKYDTAIIYAEKILKLEPNELINDIQTGLTLEACEKRKSAINFINVLYQAKINGLNEIIEPVYFWNQIRLTSDEDSLIEYYSMLINKFQSNPLSENKAEIYILKSLGEPNIKEIISEKNRVNALLNINKKAIKELENLNDLSNLPSRNRRAYLRLVIRYTYFNLFNLTNNAEYLKLASLYSPDKLDIRHPAGYIYYSIILTGDYENYSFQQNYIDFLVVNDRKSEALIELTSMTFNHPLDSNMTNLVSLFSETNPTEDFNKYWYDFIAVNSKEFPDINFITIDSVHYSTQEFIGKWTLIDVWGTWCSPCIAELPKLQSFYRDSLSAYNNQLNIITFSSDSNNLKEFMKKNNYSFPVAEIDKNLVKRLDIYGFPTKFLINPEGKYVVIPFNSNWIDYVRNFSLTKKSR